MEKTILVSLVSDQTMPNVQFIKQLKNEVSDYLFITTKGMETKGTRRWIETACNIKGQIIEVDQFSFTDIVEKLSLFDFDDFHKIFVNLTGGTKIMTLVAYDFFKNKAADIYYVTGLNNDYIKLFPVKKNSSAFFSDKVTLDEYLKCYGFETKKSVHSGISFEQTESVFKSFCKIDLLEYKEAVRTINSRRGKTIASKDFGLIAGYLEALGYKPLQANCLSKAETKYLSGDWFEEYVGARLKRELNLTDDDLFVGCELKKELSQRVKNDSKELLGELAMEKEDFKNEMDVMFMYNNKFYTIECKTSIVAYKNIQKNGQVEEKAYNILGETIYKSDSLKTRFGLFANTTILTLTDFVEYCKNEDQNVQNNRVREIEEVINRANLSNIKLIDRNMLVSADSLFNLINK